MSALFDFPRRCLYLGGFDWQGGQIEANTRRRLEQFTGPLEWERLALTGKGERIQSRIPRDLEA
jgi:hypothetical protein